MGKLTTAITDPAECSAAVGGEYQHAYVTIVDVKANASSSASDSGSGWEDLTPGMKPTQVDLLGSAASGGCFLATLGDNLEVQAGTYQQIRLILGTNSSTMVNGTNQCNAMGGLSAVNCVQMADNSWKALTTPSAQQTGIKIPAAQIAGGSLNVGAGKTEDLVINFKTCESILKAGNSGQWILKPVLNAGQVSTASTSINGTVVDAATSKAIAGANVLVSLEQPDTNGVDRVVESTRAAPDGSFAFCPVMPGTYDVVVNAYNATTKVAYNVAVETGVQPGDTTGNIQLTNATFSTATLIGMATTQNGSSAGTSALVNFYPLEANPVTSSSTKYFTVPLLQMSQSDDTATLMQEATASPYVDPDTKAQTSCPANTDCAPYSMTVPQSGISVYTYSTSGPQVAGTTAMPSATALASYVVDAQTWLPSDPTTADCSPSELMTAPPTTISAGANVGSTLTVDTSTQALSFSGCQ